VGDAYLKLASIQFANKDFVQAARNYERVLKLKGARPQLARNAAFNKILVYEKMEKFDTAIDAARFYLERFPEAPDIDRVRIKEAIFLMAWDKYEEALRKFKGILSRARDEELKSEVNFWIGECLFSLGQYEDAIEVYLRLVYFGQGKMMWKVTAEYKAGMAYEKLGRTDEAKKIYEYMTLHYGIATEWGRAAAKRLKMLKE
jgi:tetratricopeptide (TPR) repeat protein